MNVHTFDRQNSRISFKSFILVLQIEKKYVYCLDRQNIFPLSEMYLSKLKVKLQVSLQHIEFLLSYTLPQR